MKNPKNLQLFYVKRAVYSVAKNWDKKSLGTNEESRKTERYASVGWGFIFIHLFVVNFLFFIFQFLICCYLFLNSFLFI